MNLSFPDSRSLDYPIHMVTERLEIRPLKEEDWTNWKAFMSDVEALRYFPGFKSSEAELNAKNWINKQLDRYESGSFGMHAILDKNSKAFIGQCGLLTQEINGKKELEIGYSFIRRYWGKGYASESASFIKTWGFENTNIDSIISIIKRDNEASKAVAKKMGMKPNQDLTWKDIAVSIYRINNPNSGL